MTALENHLTDWNDTVFPHLLMGQFSEVFLQAWRSGNTFSTLLHDLETAILAECEDVSNLVAVSFVENVGELGVDASRVFAEFPGLLEQFRVVFVGSEVNNQ